MAIYAGIDLHSNSNFLSVIDDAGKIIEKPKLTNDVHTILHPLAIYRDQLMGDPFFRTTMRFVTTLWTCRGIEDYLAVARRCGCSGGLDPDG